MQIISVTKENFDKFTPWVVKKLTENNVKLRLNKVNEVLEYESDDPYIEMKAKDVLMALVFGPKDQKFQRSALSLFSDEYVLKLIDLGDVVGSKKDASRIMARIIGSKGKTKGIIEEITETNITISGDKILIIGRLEGVELASQAIDALVHGSPHKKVYNLLEMGRRKVKESRMKLWKY